MSITNGNIEIEMLELDPFNPRLPTNLHSAKQEDILKFMLSDEGIIELMKSIAESGYFSSEPLLVTLNESTEKYTVVEGNRRLTALILLKNPALAPIREKSINDICSNIQVPLPERIPAIIYDRREDILECLGYRHITGIKSWGSLEKARYLKQIYDTEKTREQTVTRDIFRILSQKIGSNPSNVAKLLLGYALYEKAIEKEYFDMPNELSEENIDFSLLTTAITSPKIRNFMGIDGLNDINLNGIDIKKTKEMFYWIYHQDANGKTKVGESRNISSLAEVVSTPRALDVFRTTEDLERAILYTGILDDRFKTLINKSEVHLNECKNMLETLDSPDQGILETLERISKTSKTISASLQSNYFDKQEDE